MVKTLRTIALGTSEPEGEEGGARSRSLARLRKAEEGHVQQKHRDSFCYGNSAESVSTPLVADSIDWNQKEKFSNYRRRCIANPPRAAETLDSCAKVEICVLRGRSLAAWTPMLTFQTPAEPYVKIFLDDQEVGRTAAAGLIRTSCPEWSKQVEFIDEHAVGITPQNSMLRLQVLDSFKNLNPLAAEVGFVEFPVAQLPWEETIIGWFELRFMEELQGTSDHRFLDHAKRRDEDTHKADDKLRAHMVEQKVLAMAQAASFGACSGSRGRVSSDAVQGNAGEILVALKLTRKGLGSWFDTTIALALDAPAPTYFPAKPRNHEAAMLPVMSFEALGDTLSDIKVSIFDGVLVCCANYISFILQWRWPALSAFIVAALIVSWWFTYLAWIIIPGLLAFLLLLLKPKWVRERMCIGGFNAPFSEEGFAAVARWRSTEAMTRYVRRIVLEDLQGKVTDDAELRKWSARCFHDGVPRISFNDFRNALKKEPWTGKTCGEVKAGALVLVDGSHRAVVKQVDANADVTVKYEEPDETKKKEELVTVDRVALRQRLLPNLPHVLIPDNLEIQVRMIEHNVDKIKKHFTKPLILLSQVFTWQKPLTAACIVFLLIGFSVMETLAQFGIVSRHWKDLRPGQRHIVEEVSYVVMTALKYAVSGLCGLLAIGFLIGQARWFIPVRALLRIASRWCCMRRNAPKNWAFVRQDDASAEFKMALNS